ncbi:D-aminoacyl-tRNA deacylase [Halomontanus rarus]|uniref:D-aminoacyl-tRNA deacylase n=1 Tax=Halomontanus rarus TaxID=3034020 RepID=UPI001A993366
MTVIAIVESRADRASTHICNELRDRADWETLEDATRPDADGGGTWYRTDGFELRSFDDLHLELESPVDAFDCDPDLLVFASRHAGDTGALLTGHFTGNFGPAEFGGEDGALAEACPNALAVLREAFEEYAPPAYDVGLECTHHGPTDVGCPSLFAELGSSDEQWDDPAGAEAVARSILALRDTEPHRKTQLVGFGGNHYVPRFERIVRETPWAVGHVGADWALEAMGDPDAHREVIDRAFAASDADLAVVDDDRPALEAVVEDLGYRVVSETWVREVGDRSLEVVDRVEAELGSIDDSVRFGDRREASFTLVELPSELLGAAEGIDPDRVRTVLEAHAIAFETTNGGSRIGAHAAVPVGSDSFDTTDTRGSSSLEAVENLLAELVAILREKYDEVRLESDGVVAREEAFDPDRATELGVPEGPKFGALAGGESVTVDGESISPEDVRTERRSRFSLPRYVDDE